MKTSFEYGDPYRFLVSAGIVLITIGLLVPWLLLQVSLDIVISTADLAQLTPVAQEIVVLRQSSALWLMRNIGWIAVACVGLGLVLVLGGMVFWYRRYRQEEAAKVLQEARQRIEAQRSIPDEYEHLVSLGKAELGSSALKLDTTDDGQQAYLLTIAKWREITNYVTHQLRDHYRETHVVVPEWIVGETTYIVLRSRHRENPDAIVKVKYAEGTRPATWYEQAFGQTALAVEAFQGKRPEAAVSLVLFVTPEAADERKDHDDTIRDVHQQLGQLRSSVRWKRVSIQQLQKSGEWIKNTFPDKVSPPPGRRAAEATSRTTRRLADAAFEHWWVLVLMAALLSAGTLIALLADSIMTLQPGTQIGLMMALGLASLLAVLRARYVLLVAAKGLLTLNDSNTQMVLYQIRVSQFRLREDKTLSGLQGFGVSKLRIRRLRSSVVVEVFDEEGTSLGETELEHYDEALITYEISLRYEGL